VKESQLRYNAMLLGVSSFCRPARANRSVPELLDTVRDYWITRAEL